MKIAILSRSPRCYSTRRLREAATSRGHKPTVLDTLRFSISLEEGEPDLHYKGKPLSHYDAMIPRIGASITYYGTAVVRQFEQMNVFCANSAPTASPIHATSSGALQILSKHDVGIPAHRLRAR